MKKIKAILIIAAVSISLLTIGVVEVGGKSNNPDVEHKDARVRINAAIERGDITPEQGQQRLESLHRRTEKDFRWDKRGKRRLIKEFGITEDQLATIKELRKRQREDMKALRKRYHETFLNILTDEQRQKWDEKMRGDSPRLPTKHKPDKDLPVGESIGHERVGKYSNDNVREINTSAQEITWGELKSNN